VPDATDLCPDVGYLNTPDGCPPDSDGDGVRDPDDHCPGEVGLDVLDGCPDLDADKDGVREPLDRCPSEAGVPPDGCPVKDQDGDGILDGVDRCPSQAENKNGFEDDDGCPDTPLAPPDLSKLEGVIPGIEFDANEAALIPTNPASLQDAAELLTQYPNLRVEISGHTDNQGGQAANEALSQRRADAVKRWLVDHGVAAERIAAVGRGSSEPRASNRTTEGRASNRRLELRVVTD
jgi:OOP family OmpA-OmpF porin